MSPSMSAICEINTQKQQLFVCAVIQSKSKPHNTKDGFVLHIITLILREGMKLLLRFIRFLRATPGCLKYAQNKQIYLIQREFKRSAYPKNKQNIFTCQVVSNHFGLLCPGVEITSDLFSQDLIITLNIFNCNMYFPTISVLPDYSV